MKTCAVKNNFIERLSSLAQEHFQITRRFSARNRMPAELKERCEKLRSEWTRVHEAMQRHRQGHAC
jgi:hypothetical protein